MAAVPTTSMFHTRKGKRFLCIAAVASLAVGGLPFLLTDEASAATPLGPVPFSPDTSQEVTTSEVEFLGADVDESYTSTGPVSEAEGDAQQAEALAVEEEDGEGDTDVHIARVDFDSDVVGVAATWDLDALEPASVHLRYLQDGTWSEWTELDFELLPTQDESAPATRAGTEPYLLANADAAEVVARTAEGVSLPGLAVTVLDARGLEPVDNSLTELEGTEEPVEQDLEEELEDAGDAVKEGLDEVDGPDEVEPLDAQDDAVLDLDETAVGEGTGSDERAFFRNALGGDTAAISPAALNSAGTVYDTGFNGLKITTRKGWGADESLMKWKPEAITIKGAVVHHTQGNYSYTQAQSAAQVRIIYNYHAKTLGWGDIGYNLIVDKYGGVWEGRSGGLTKAIKGAQAYGANSETFGISIMGDFTSVAPPTAARKAMSNAIAWKLQTHGIKSVSGTIRVPGSDLKGRNVPVVSGHRDIGGTDCPGNAFYAQMGTVRSEVTSYLASGSQSSGSSGGSTGSSGGSSGSSGGSSSSSGSTSTGLSATFDASNVIPDALFYDSSTMTEAQIKTFIQDAGKNCKASSGKTCLKDKKFPTQNLTTLRGGCKAISMSGNQAPWTIIHKTAQACGLNPQVILVTLQKEQSALAQPKSDAQWAKAMGSGCPDGSGCAPKQAGFMKQVYYGSDKLVSYKLRSIAGHVQAFKDGKAMTVLHNPSSSCGSQSLKFANVATASLYEYTPYIGNSSKSGCDASGQKMFWDLMKRYFPNAQSSGGSGSSGGSSSGSSSSSGSTSKPSSASPITWQAKKQIGNGWPSRVIYPGDFTGNGYPDMMLINSKGDLMLYEGRASERFAAPKRIGNGWNGIDWVQGGVDWDGDGKTDLVARVKSTGDLRLYPGNGKGGFGKAKKIGNGWQNLTHLTLTRTARGPSIYAVSNGRMLHYPGTGKGGFAAKRTLGTGWNAMTKLTAVGDWSGDGNPDLLARDSNGDLYLYKGNANGDPGARVKVGSGWQAMTNMGVANQSKAKSPVWAIDASGRLYSYGVK